MIREIIHQIPEVSDQLGKKKITPDGYIRKEEDKNDGSFEETSFRMGRARYSSN